MKRIFFTGAVLSLILLYSCKDFLVTDPTDKIYLDDYFKSAYDIDDAARGMYDGLQGCVEKMFVWGEMRGDLVWPGSGAGWELRELSDLNISTNNRFTDWSEFYDVINRANLIIKYAPRVLENDFNFTETEAKQFVAEAVNVRSLCYFWLVRTFGDVPFILEPFDENYLDTKIDTIYNADGNKTAVELPVYYVDPLDADIILDSLEVQLKRVEGIDRTYPQEFGSGNSRNPAIYTSRFKAIANLVLQADIKMWRNKYADALALAERAFSYDPLVYNLGNYQSAPVCYNQNGNPVQRWINIFINDGSLTLESILELRFQSSTPDYNVLQKYTSSLLQEGGKYLVRPSEKSIEYWQNDTYYGRIYTDTVDIMRGYNASFTGAYDSLEGRWVNPEIFKFIINGTDGLRRTGFESDSNWNLYRMADVLCIISECLNRQGYIRESILRLQGSPYWTLQYSFNPANEGRMGLRKRACVAEYITSLDATPDVYEAEEIILEERAKELAFEGRRWFDMIRIAKRGQLELFLDEMEYGAPEDKKSVIRARAANPENWFLPYHDNARKFFVNPDYENKAVEKIKNRLGL
jgi:hypothetical protein